jgi:glycerophosphoryl diester phosphodiesterase
MLLAPFGGPCLGARRAGVESVELIQLRRVPLLPPRVEVAPHAAAGLIAHGGGAVRDVVLSNSLEALVTSHEAGLRLFEIDLNWTDDGGLVLIHDWGDSVGRLFGRQPGRPTVEQFEGWRMVEGLTQLTLDDAMAWLARTPDARFVTDVKEENLRALGVIAARFPELRERVIPQIYRFREYEPVRGLGFSDVILTLYAKNYSDGAVMEFARRREVWAVTMPVDRGRGDLPSRLGALGCSVYVHTVNDAALTAELGSHGVDGFYTDTLRPAI